MYKNVKIEIIFTAQWFMVHIYKITSIDIRSRFIQILLGHRKQVN